ncbi:MAG: alpha/beta hydrolase [Betaproteobacteria bacterium]
MDRVDNARMIPFHFGSAERPLFGLFHPAEGEPADDRAVLLCNPFGQEAVRSHRLFRVLGERLARGGIAVLRFDYHATGDSPGADDDGDIAGWVLDTRTALRELARRSGARSVVCVGARLGAVMAARAATGIAELRRLVLWDPIVNGPDYLELLRVKHVEALESSFSLSDPAWRARLAGEPAAFTDEAMGFAISPTLRQQIRQVGAHSLPLPPGVQLQVIAHPADAAVDAWAATFAVRGIAAQRWPLEESFDWAAEEERNSPLVPPAALVRLMSAIRD